MSVQPYRDVLNRPGVRSLLLVCLLARIPITIAPIALTLHVVLDLHAGFAQSGLIAAMVALGAAVGSPLLGSAMDRIGLRPVLVVTTVAEVVFWVSAAYLPYPALGAAAFASGVLALPVFTLSRQSLAALVPPHQRQAGFSLDSMSVEIAFAFGPALGVVLVTQVGAPVAFAVVAALMITAGGLLIRLDPPIHGSAGDVVPGAARVAVTDRPGMRSWLTGRVLAILLATFGATFTLVGTETAFTAAMREFGQISLLGVIVAIWCIASLVGGFVYGLSRHKIGSLVLLALLAGFTVPIALAGHWWMLAVLSIPTGLFCAPLISSTAEELTAITPTSVRGQVMGTHASALTIGNAAGAPLIGMIIDHSAARWGFVGVGTIGLAIALAGIAAVSYRQHHRTGTPTPPSFESAESAFSPILAYGNSGRSVAGQRGGASILQTV